MYAVLARAGRPAVLRSGWRSTAASLRSVATFGGARATICADFARGCAAAVPASRALSTTPSADVNDFVDVAIVGGGVVGAALACQLGASCKLRHGPLRATGSIVQAPQMADMGRSLALVEVKAPPTLEEVRAIEDPDLRVFAITPASANTLRAAGVWDDVVGVRHAPPYTRMQVWDSRGSGLVRFGSDADDAEPLGHILENRVLQSALFDRVRQLADDGALQLLCPANLEKVVPPRQADEPRRARADAAPQDALACLHFEGGRNIDASLVVGADGAASRVRGMSGVGTWGWDYDQRGLVCAIRTSGAQRTAWQRFRPHGPVAVLPLWDDLASIVWSTTPAHAAELQALPEEAFVAELNAALGVESESAEEEGASSPPAPTGEAFGQSSVPPLLQPLEQVVAGVTNVLNAVAPPGHRYEPPPRVYGVAGPRASFPLRFAHANRYVRHRVALIGDAAHSVHPLAGQGLNLGIADAASLASTLLRAIENGEDVGKYELLERYERDRKLHNLAMMSTMDVIKNVFDGRLDGPFAWVRNAGMSFLNAAGPIKSGVARYAAGSGRLWG